MEPRVLVLTGVEFVDVGIVGRTDDRPGTGRRIVELERIHATGYAPDDLAMWPPELDGGTRAADPGGVVVGSSMAAVTTLGE